MDSSGSLSERRGWRSFRSTGNGRGRVLRHRVERDPHRGVHAPAIPAFTSPIPVFTSAIPTFTLAIPAFTSAIRAFTARRSERSRPGDLGVHVRDPSVHVPAI